MYRDDMYSDIKKARKKDTMEQIRAVQEILRQWDPMDLAPGEFAPKDEYDGYATHIVSLVNKGCSAEGLLGHLQKLRRGMVCMRDNPERDKEIANQIITTLRSKMV